LNATELQGDNASEENITKAEQNIKEVRQQLDAWIEQGLPIGWSYYPTCVTDEIDTRCVAGGVAAAVPWFFSTLLGGLLIGLGGSFWFALCSKLMSLVQVAPAQTNAGGNGETATTSPQPRTAAQAFDAAILLETAVRHDTAPPLPPRPAGRWIDAMRNQHWASGTLAPTGDTSDNV
jgi:hypothetical protein